MQTKCWLEQRVWERKKAQEGQRENKLKLFKCSSSWKLSERFDWAGLVLSLHEITRKLFFLNPKIKSTYAIKTCWYFKNCAKQNVIELQFTRIMLHYHHVLFCFQQMYTLFRALPSRPLSLSLWTVLVAFFSFDSFKLDSSSFIKAA